MLNEEYIHVLTELGLTRLQAKVYVALLYLKCAPARSIQTFSKVSRQDVYHVLSELRKQDLIEKIIAKPTKFRPIPPNDVISILLKRRNELSRQLEEKAVQVFTNFKDEDVELSPLDGVSQFILLSRSKTNPTAHVDKMGKAVDNAKKSVMCSTTFPLFLKIKAMDEQIWKKAVRRGVKFRFIIGGRPNEQLAPDLDPVLKNTDHFEIRWTSKAPPACVLVIDGKEAFCRVGREVVCPVLFSVAPSFVNLMKDYFETKWKLLERRQNQQILAKMPFASIMQGS
jgi:sugar-specific transcriptional regulator TrmB